MIKRLWSFITGGKLVWLRDFDGELSLSIARIDPWGKMTAKRYWPYNIKTVELLPDGTVDGAYVRFWKDYKKATVNNEC